MSETKHPSVFKIKAQNTEEEERHVGEASI